MKTRHFTGEREAADENGQRHEAERSFHFFVSFYHKVGVEAFFRRFKHQLLIVVQVNSN
jgi:hypothetical protein